jgi:hypothetical protein
MSEQQSQKEGLRSSAQKEERARDAKAPVPASNPVGGAFGERERPTPTDKEASLDLDEPKRT